MCPVGVTCEAAGLSRWNGPVVRCDCYTERCSTKRPGRPHMPVVAKDETTSTGGGQR